MRRVSTIPSLPWPVEVPDEWMAACGPSRDEVRPARVPKALELALVRGLIEERRLTDSEPGSRWTSAGRIAASLTIWGFAAYGLWTLLG